MYILLKGYSVAAPNESCPEDEVVLTEGACAIAAKALGLTYKGSCPTKCMERPAGCYTMLHTGARDTYFNINLSPSILVEADDRAGICRKHSKKL